MTSADPTSARHEKLVRKLRNLGLDESPNAILSLDPTDFGSVPGVGRKYVRMLREVQDALRVQLGTEPHDALNSPDPLEPARADGLGLVRSALSDSERKAIEKCVRYLKVDAFDVEVLLGIDNRGISNEPGIGSSTARELAKLQARVLDELRVYSREPGRPPDGRLFSVSAQEHYSPADVERLILDDLDAFFLSQDDTSRLIVMHRTAFGVPAMSLESIGAALGVTRERVRQIEAREFQALRQCFRIGKTILLENVLQALEDHEIAESFPLFANCFTESKGAARMLAEILDYDLLAREGLRGSYPHSLLDPLFAQVGRPCTADEICAHLASEEAFSDAQALGSIRYLVRAGFLLETENGMQPARMRRKPSLAYVLASAPEPLHWTEIVRRANRLGVANAPFDPSRPPPALQTSEHVYLAGRGTYWHVQFLDLDKLPEKHAADVCLRFLAAEGETSANLVRIHTENASEIGTDYWTFRHVVSGFDGEYGLHFRGQSSVDTISTDSAGARVSLREMLRRIIASSESPMTVEELANYTRTGNTALVNLHVSALAQSGDIARVSQGAYQSLERVLGEVDHASVIAAVRPLLSEEQLFWDADALRAELNPRFGIDCTYHWWLALLTAIADSGGWHVGGTLVGLTQPPDNGLKGVFIGLGWNKPIAELLEEAKSSVRMTAQTLHRAQGLLYANRATTSGLS